MKHFLILLFSVLFTSGIQAQLEKVIVEKYYISDSTDATDTIGGYLAKGSVTYRVYVDLAPGCKLLKIFGDNRHLLKISSDSILFNHIVDGTSFGKDIDKNLFSGSTLPLDTWITIGYAAKKSSTAAYSGILKPQDTNGSFIDGTNNLLMNTAPQAGIPISEQDGIGSASAVSSTSWINSGFLDDATLDDSTIFGSLNKTAKVFNSNGRNVYLTNTKGISGATPDSNQVLIAQLTTKGKIAFELNLEVIGPNGKVFTYIADGKDTVATDSSLIVKHSPYLTYPVSCGCLDPHYLEYSTKFSCADNTTCKTRIVCGCTDSMACNYDPRANVNIPAFCCYPGYCNDRDIAVVCPAINNTLLLTFYPNPTEDLLTIQVSGNNEDKDVKYAIYDVYGLLKTEKSLRSISGLVTERVDVSGYTQGMYWIKVSVGNTTTSKLFMKK
jgi:hypothetical protein